MTELDGALAEIVLPLQAALPVDRLEPDVIAAIHAAGIDTSSHRFLVLLGQAGRTLWDRAVATRLDRPDPFDETATELARAWLVDAHPEATFTLLYPGPAALPLGRHPCVGSG